MNGHVSRRSFLRTTSLAASSLSLLAPRLWGQGSPPALVVDRTVSGVAVPPGFVGLSYENMQLEDPEFFSASNRSLVEQFRKMAPRGVLRLGGNTSEFGWWKAQPGAVVPRRVDSPWKAAGEPTAATVFAITPQAIDNLHAFLQATGWSCIYGLNLGYGTPESDLPEAEYVARVLGPKLEYFQIGNEVDLFKGHLRNPDTWGVSSYLQQWLTIAQAVQKVLPAARFGLPDVAADITWLPRLAELWAGVANKPTVVSLSHHYYWDGPPSNPRVTAENLLKPSRIVEENAVVARNAAQAFGPGVTYRMTEGNTVYRGGKYGVSDVEAAALWSADYLLHLMQLGYAGVNLHGGSGHAQAVSVGGTFHGEALMPDPNVPHPKPFYTPIANEGTLAGSGVNGKLNGTYLLEPVGYGMKFAAAFAGCTLLPVRLDLGSHNASAFAARRPDGRLLVAVINKEPAQPLPLTVGLCTILQTLSASSIESRDVVLQEPATPSRVGPTVTIPPHTAYLLQLA